MTLGDRPIRFPDIHFTRYHTASAGHASSHHCLHAPRAPSPRTAPPPPPTTPPDTRHTCTADFHGRVLPRRRHLPRARPAQVLRTAPRAAAGPAQLPCRSGPPAATVSYPPSGGAGCRRSPGLWKPSLAFRRQAHAAHPKYALAPPFLPRGRRSAANAPDAREPPAAARGSGRAGPRRAQRHGSRSPRPMWRRRWHGGGDGGGFGSGRAVGSLWVLGWDPGSVKLC